MQGKPGHVKKDCPLNHDKEAYQEISEQRMK